MIDVRHCHIHHFKNDLFEKYLTSLPAFMQQDICRYKMLKDRQSRLLARLMIQQYLQEKKYDGTLDSWQKTIDEKPFIANGPAFNITHSGDIVAVAFSDQSIGIDIEKISDVDVQGLSTYLHHQEKIYIDRASDKQDAFFTIWAKKEAYLKATGKGIASGLSKMSVVEDIVSGDSEHWYLREIVLDQAYKCYVCAPNVVHVVNVQPYTI